MSSLQLPVNSYDTTGATIEDQVHAMIRKDLAVLGEITEITGSIITTPRHGTKLSGVSVTVEHPRMRLPMTLEVAWGENEDSLVYRDRTDQLVFTPSTESGYGTDDRTEMEEDLVAKIFSRLDAHSLLVSSKNPGKISGKSVLGSLAFAASLPTTAALASDSPLVGLVSLAIALPCVMIPMVDSSRPHREAQKKSDHWNAESHQMLLNAFTSDYEKALFMDAFYAKLEEFGLDDNAKLGVTKMHARQMRRGRLHDDELLDEIPLRSPMMSFRARDTWFGANQEIYWDGASFFARLPAAADGSFPARFFPLSPPAEDWRSQPKEMQAEDPVKAGSPKAVVVDVPRPEKSDFMADMDAKYRDSSRAMEEKLLTIQQCNAIINHYDDEINNHKMQIQDEISYYKMRTHQDREMMKHLQNNKNKNWPL